MVSKTLLSELDMELLCTIEYISTKTGDGATIPEIKAEMTDVALTTDEIARRVHLYDYLEITVCRKNQNENLPQRDGWVVRHINDWSIAYDHGA